MTGLEYGSGRSTLFFARRLKKLVSIEHHEGWHNKVSQILKDKKVDNVEYLLIPEDGKSAEDISEAELHKQLNQLTGDEPREEYFSYYSRVESYPDDYFDFILIDGRARVQCGLRAMKKIKPGGIFVLDNSERERYHPLHEALRDWPHLFTTNGITDTVLWIRPLD